MNLLTQRYRELVLSLRDQVGSKKGWRDPVAIQLGVSPSFLSKVVSGSRDVSPATAADGLKRLGLPADYFKTKRDFASHKPDEKPFLSENERALLRALNLATAIHVGRAENGRESLSDLLELLTVVSALPWVATAITAHSDDHRKRECASTIARALFDMQALRHALRQLVAEEVEPSTGSGVDKPADRP